MSLPGPLPPALSSPTGGGRFHTTRTSGDGPDKDYILRDIVRIWNGPPGHTKTEMAAKGRQNRWKTIKLLRVLLLSTEKRNTVVPAAFQAVANDPTLSQVGIAIGSKWCGKRKKHLDIDWFGPQRDASQAPVLAGQNPTTNWWKADLDGATAQVALATELMHYLEASLGLEPSGATPSTWSWSPGLKGEDPLAMLEDPAVDAQVEAAAARQPYVRTSLEWWVGSEAAANPVRQFAFSVLNTKDSCVFRIETPDCSPPDPN